MNKRLVIILFLLCFIICVGGRKTSRGRSSSGRGSSRRTGYPQPAPTSFSNPQPSAPKPTLFGWQEKPAQKSLSSWQTKTQQNKQSHSYPSSQTGLSGTKTKPSPNQESIQRSQAPQPSQSRPGTQTQGNNGHSYPSSNGLSGSASAGYPQGSGLSGSGAAKPVSAGNSGASYPQGSGLSGASAPHSGSGVPQGSGSVPGSSYPHGTGSQGTGYTGARGPPPPPYPGNHPNTGSNYGSPNYGSNYHHPPPPNYGGHGVGFPNAHQMPGYFGNSMGNNYGGVSRSSSALKGIGIAGAGVGTILTGLALWNLARSTGHHHHTVIYDNRGQPVAVAPANDTNAPTDSFLKDLVNCSLTISTDNATEVLAIPCAIATSFSPDADVKDVGSNTNNADNTRCIVTVVTKTGKEYMTTISCATLINTAAENNVTEPPPIIANGTDTTGQIAEGENTFNPVPPTALSLSSVHPELNNTTSSSNCTYEPGAVRDPINPCFAVTSDLTVLPLETTSKPIETTQ